MTNIAEDFVASSTLNEKLCYGKAWPLPRLTDAHKHNGDNDTYEVVIVGAGPAGLLLTLELSRLGLSDTSLLCIDAKEEGTKAGHADGVNARSQEILRTLGLEADLLREGNAFSEMAFWAQSETDALKLERVNVQPFLLTPAVRFEQLKTLHQGRIERIFRADLQRYSRRGVQYSTSVQKVWLDEDANPKYPVVAILEHAGSIRTIRTKYLVGADGARSVVRKSTNIEMDGDITDIVWGVVDLIADTNFPDIRRASTIEGTQGQGRGDALIVPRERCSDGSYMTRLYIDMTDYEEIDALCNGVKEFATEAAKTATKQRRAAITANAILSKGASILRQYRFKIKAGTSPFWWASYSIGQRLAREYTVSDSHSMPRIFLAGDACHTHSPRQGQGMNISMQDAHNLAWKLAHALFSLTPHPAQLLRTYESERRPTAEKVVFFDKRWNQSEIGREESIAEAREQVLGCGVEYDSSLLVTPSSELASYPITGTDYISGVLRPGRRLLNVRVRRFADGTMWDIHDDLRSDGRWRVIVVCADDFPDPKSQSLPAVTSICGTVVKRYQGLLEAIMLQPEMQPTWDFDDLPECVKDEAEMRVYCAPKSVYDVYGVDLKKGAIVLIRPDGVVGFIGTLKNVRVLDEFLGQVLDTK